MHRTVMTAAMFFTCITDICGIMQYSYSRIDNSWWVSECLFMKDNFFIFLCIE